MHTTLTLHPSGPGLTEFTDKVTAFVAGAGVESGVLNVYCRHTSASLLIQENADPDVQADLLGFFERLVPFGDDPEMAWLTHTTEGPDDMPAHIKAALTQTSVTIPILSGALALGTWQGIYLFEHRTRPRPREIVLSLIRA